MKLVCPCGSVCIRNAFDVSNNIKNLFSPCNDCTDPKFKKFKPLKDQISLEKLLDINYGDCKCGKRHLDTVMAHILKIMIDEGVRDVESTLRNSCTPLITPGYPVNTIPWLYEDSMVVLAEGIDLKCAERIYNEIPEVKGVLRGSVRETVGVKDSKSLPHVYELLAGCDMRCDHVSTPYGDILIYKNQSEIHIEFAKPSSPKVEIIKEFMDKYENPAVLDCTCGPGTLGIACLKGGAKSVVFNDIWYPAAKMTCVNLEVNGFKTDFFDVKNGLVGSGDNFQVYCEDIKELKNLLVNEKFDFCIVDTFPGVDTREFIDSLTSLSTEIVVI